MNKVFIFSIIPLNNAVSDANTVQMWVKQVEDTGEAVKEGKHMDDADLLEHLL